MRRKRSPVFQPLALLSLLLGLCLTATAHAQSLPQRQHTSDAANYGNVMIGPVEGLTTSWHQAPRTTGIPRGTTVVFRIDVPQGAKVTWTGADEIKRGARSSFASVACETAGKREIRVVAEAQDGWNTAKTFQLEILSITPDKIRVSPVKVSVAPMGVDESSSNAALMHRAMAHESVAKLTHLGTDAYATSVMRTLHMTVKVDPPAFAPLMEWSVEGAPRNIGKRSKIRFREKGRRLIAVGPQHRKREIDIDIYSVTVVGPTNLPDHFFNFPPVSFHLEATTDPPGYEDRVTWLATTAYGNATPIIGEGSSFDFEIDDPRSPTEDVWVLCVCDGGLGPDGKFEEHKQHLHDCFIVSCMIPNNLMQCMSVGGAGGLKDIRGSFNMDVTFGGWCGCCEYRQYVKGTFMHNGTTLCHNLAPGVKLDPNNYNEDFPYYGHRNLPGNAGNNYSNGMGMRDQAGGCVYHGSDRPGLSNVPCGDTYSIDLMFRGEVIDNCEGTIEKVSEWVIQCSGTALDAPESTTTSTILIDIANRAASVNISISESDNLLTVDFAIDNGDGSISIDESEINVEVLGLTKSGGPPSGPLLETIVTGAVSHGIYRFAYPAGSSRVLTVFVTYGNETQRLSIALD